MIHGLSAVFSKTFADTSTEVNGVFLWLNRGLNISLFVNWLTPAKKKKTQETNQIEQTNHLAAFAPDSKFFSESFLPLG